MRKFFLLPVIILFIASCTTDKTKESAKEAPNSSLKDTTVVDAPSIVPSGLKLIPFKLSDKNCDFVLPEDMELDEGWCNTRELAGLRVTLTDAAVAQKINGLICKEITGKVGNVTTLKKFVADIKTLSNEEGDMERKVFENDLSAKVFYDELMSEQNSTQSE